jgi:hypothetical protein
VPPRGEHAGAMGRRLRGPVSVYRACWLIAAATLHGAGWWGAFTVSLATVLFLSVAGALLGGSVCLARRNSDAAARSQHAAPTVCLAVAGTALSAVAVGGLVGALGGAVGLTLLVVVTATSPTFVAHFRRRLFPLPRSVGRRIDAFVWALAFANPDPSMGTTLESRPSTDEELCRAWCTTYQALQASTSRRQRLALVQERRAILDELARRNPLAFVAWLVEATPGDSPWPYLSVDHFQPTSIDWDELMGGSDPE